MAKAPRSPTGVETACCGAEPRITVRLLLQIPLSLNRRLTKAALRSSEVVIEGADWERSIWQCPGCKRIWPPGELPDLR